MEKKSWEQGLKTTIRIDTLVIFDIFGSKSGPSINSSLTLAFYLFANISEHKITTVVKFVKFMNIMKILKNNVSFNSQVDPLNHKIEVFEQFRVVKISYHEVISDLRYRHQNNWR